MRGHAASGGRAACAHPDQLPETNSNDFMNHKAVELLLGGRVQGVGFRPFVYLLAERYKING